MTVFLGQFIEILHFSFFREFPEPESGEEESGAEEGPGGEAETEEDAEEGGHEKVNGHAEPKVTHTRKSTILHTLQSKCHFNSLSMKFHILKNLNWNSKFFIY